jgi:RNA polymerase sigma-70 factor (ECF subfamily)
MHHLESRPLAEIAEALGTTRPAVAGLLHRGLKALRTQLAEDGES